MVDRCRVGVDHEKFTIQLETLITSIRFETKNENETVYYQRKISIYRNLWMSDEFC